MPSSTNFAIAILLTAFVGVPALTYLLYRNRWPIHDWYHHRQLQLQYWLDQRRQPAVIPHRPNSRILRRYGAAQPHRTSPSFPSSLPSVPSTQASEPAGVAPIQEVESDIGEHGHDSLVRESSNELPIPAVVPATTTAHSSTTECSTPRGLPRARDSLELYEVPNPVSANLPVIWLSDSEPGTPYAPQSPTQSEFEAYEPTPTARPQSPTLGHLEEARRNRERTTELELLRLRGVQVDIESRPINRPTHLRPVSPEEQSYLEERLHSLGVHNREQYNEWQRQQRVRNDSRRSSSRRLEEEDDEDYRKRQHWNRFRNISAEDERWYEEDEFRRYNEAHRNPQELHSRLNANYAPPPLSTNEHLIYGRNFAEQFDSNRQYHI